MVEEDVGHRHACLGVVRRQVGDLAQLLQRALHVAARYRKLRVRHRHAHLPGGAKGSKCAWWVGGVFRGMWLATGLELIP
eukprot:208442-Chlamydomonas_euryale.AAC.3